MSNKTQLQTNNTNLDALITRVTAAKDTAASLPEAGGGGSDTIDTSMEDGLVTREVSIYTNNRVTTIGANAFARCTSLTSVSFPEVTDIGISAFYSCASLTSVSFPKVTHINPSAFYSCTSLTSVSFPKAKEIGLSAFRTCKLLTSIYLNASRVCTLQNSNAFSGTGIWSHTGSIFVPSSLVASYKAATNWVYFSSRFVGV